MKQPIAHPTSRIFFWMTFSAHGPHAPLGPASPPESVKMALTWLSTPYILVLGQLQYMFEHPDASGPVPPQSGPWIQLSNWPARFEAFPSPIWIEALRH